MNEMPKYYNWDYDMECYYQVSGPAHDHYTYNIQTNSWYENVLIDGKGYTYKDIGWGV